VGGRELLQIDTQYNIYAPYNVIIRLSDPLKISVPCFLLYKRGEGSDSPHWSQMRNGEIGCHEPWSSTERRRRVQWFDSKR